MKRTYIDSGNPLIGYIPKGWQLMRLKDVGFLYGGLTGKAGDDFDVNEDKDNFAFYIPFTNIFNNTYISPNVLGKVKVSEDEKQNEVHKGDLLFLMSSEDYDGIGKPAVIDFELTNLYLNSFCKGFRITADINSKFLNYLMSSHVERELVRLEAKGFTRINLRQDKLACCDIIVPSRLEQDRIAVFLDEKCGEIDSLIVLQEQMIEKLKAFKQSVITEAVTKGLNSNAKFVPSGIDWIGEIPEGWKIFALKWLMELYAGATPKSDNLSLWDGDIPWITPADYKTEDIYVCGGRRNISQKGFESCATTILPKGSIIFSKRAPIGLVAINSQPLCTNQGCIGCIVNQKRAFTKFYYYTLSIFKEQFELFGSGTTFKEISATKFADFNVPVPPLSEQYAIASYLDSKCADIDHLISMKQQKIEKLKEYKKSIIYEAVTGKTIIE